MKSIFIQRGVSLLEVLIATLVLTIGILGLAKLQGNALKANHSAYMRAQASILAHEMLDIMRLDRESALGQAYDGVFNVPPQTADTLVSSELNRWVSYVLDRLPLGEAEITTSGAGEVTISVRWDDSRGEEPLQGFTLRTRL